MPPKMMCRLTCTRSTARRSRWLWAASGPSATTAGSTSTRDAGAGAGPRSQADCQALEGAITEMGTANTTGAGSSTPWHVWAGVSARSSRAFQERNTSIIGQQNNAGGGLGVGERIVMVEGDPERRAYYVEMATRQVERARRQGLGANEVCPRSEDARVEAKDMEDRPVEGGVVGSDKAHAAQQRFHTGPDRREARRGRRLFTGDSVQASKAEAARRRANQRLHPGRDCAILHPHDPKRTSALGPAVGGLEVESEEGGWGHAVDCSLVSSEAGRPS